MGWGIGIGIGWPNTTSGSVGALIWGIVSSKNWGQTTSQVWG